MKSKAIIITFLVIAQIGAFALISYSQNKPATKHFGNTSLPVHKLNDSVILLADETTLTYCKTEAVIVCDNETIFRNIHETHSQLFKRFTCTWEHDKKLCYKHYVIYMDKGDAQILINWAKTNL